MTGLTALPLCRAHGVRTIWTAEGVAFEAPTTPPADVIAAIDKYEDEITALHRPDAAGLSGMDWRRIYARRLRECRGPAFQCVVTEWLNRHHQDTSPGRCAYCGKPEDVLAEGVLLPFGVKAHAWIHDRCSEHWQAARLAKAVVVLMSYGITSHVEDR